MKAAVFTGPGQLELREVPTPHASEGELVLKVGANTVCGTDARILRGEKSAGVRPGVILGHEIAGYVTEIGRGVEGFEEGDLVGINPTVSCGVCYYCRAGYEHLCAKAELFGYAIDGGLADYWLIPRAAIERGQLVKASAHLEPAQLALAEPISCCLNGMDNYRVEVGDTDGETRTLHTYNKTEQELKAWAEQELRRLKRDGLKGTFTTFGAVLIDKLDHIGIKIDGVRRGIYQVQKNVIKYGTGGFRQEITIGQKVAE
mgnify:CR=1 FL=1